MPSDDEFDFGLDADVALVAALDAAERTTASKKEKQQQQQSVVQPTPSFVKAPTQNVGGQNRNASNTGAVVVEGVSSQQSQPQTQGKQQQTLLQTVKQPTPQRVGKGGGASVIVSSR